MKNTYLLSCQGLEDGWQRKREKICVKIKQESCQTIESMTTFTFISIVEQAIGYCIARVIRFKAYNDRLRNQLEVGNMGTYNQFYFK